MSESPETPAIVDRLRSVGPAGWLLGVLLVGALVAVVAALAGGDEAAPTTTPVVAESTTSSTTIPDSEPEMTDDTTPPEDIGELVVAYEQCVRDASIPMRFQSVTDTEIIFATRPGTGAAERLDSEAGQSCYDDHLVGTGLVVSLVELDRSGGVPTTVGGGTTDTIIETTDSTEPPQRPTTDTTTP